MSLMIEVYVGGKSSRVMVAKAIADNVSDLDTLSDYVVEREEFGANHLNIKKEEVKFKIKNHRREQSVWGLVEKIAKEENLESN